MAEEGEACSAVHLPRDQFGLGVDTFGGSDGTRRLFPSPSGTDPRPTLMPLSFCFPPARSLTTANTEIIHPGFIPSWRTSDGLRCPWSTSRRVPARRWCR